MTVSLDAIDEHIFKKINDVGFSSEKVLSAIDNAEKAGLAPIKINMVVKRNVNDGDIVALAERFRGTPHIVRFIEYMDVGNTNRWHLDEVVAAADIVAAIDAVYPLAPIGANYTGRGRKALALSRRTGRDRCDQLGHPAVLLHLH